MGGVRDAILIGVALAALVLLVFLRSCRLALVAVATVPVCVALVLLGLYAGGQTVNLMTLGGIAAALGLVVDDAIVVVENIHRHREQGLSRRPALTGAVELFPALIGSSLSTIVVFLPFALLTGLVGAFFKPLALTMVLALGASFLIAAFAVPVATRFAEGLATAPPRPRGQPGAPPRRRRLARAAALLVLAGLGATGWVLYRVVETDFLPAMDEGSIILDYWTPAGTSLTDTNRMLLEAEKVIEGLPGRGQLLAAHRHPARLLHHRAQPRRLRDQAQAALRATTGRRGDRRSAGPGSPRSSRRSGPTSVSSSRTTSAT